MTHFAYGGSNVLEAIIVALTIDSPNESFFLEVDAFEIHTAIKKDE